MKNVVTAESENGAAVRIVKEEGDWALETLDSAGNCVKTVRGSDIVCNFNCAGKVISSRFSGEIEKGESFTGLGERFNGLIQNGSVITLWNHDPNTNAKKDLMETDGDKTNSYLNIPLLNSSRGYTLFFNSSYKCVADIGKNDPSVFSFDFNGDILDFYIFTGTPSERLTEYTSLTGKSILPPKWAFSYMAGNHGYVWNDAGDPVKRLKDVMLKYAALETVPSAVYGEYGPEYAEESYNILKNYGTRMLGWQDSGVSAALCSEVFGSDISKYPVIKTASGGIMSGGLSGDAYIDFTHPDGEKLFKARIQSRLNFGIKGFMVDFGDEVLPGSISYNGTLGDEMHNLYPYYYVRGVNNVMKNVYPDGDYLCYSRSGYAGTQSFSTVFLGDNPSNFMGIKQSISAGLSLSTSGFSVWGSDLGGHGGSTPPTAEVYRRWLQFSTFNPLMRAHGLTDRNPWSFGDEAVSDFKKYYWLRENMLDMIYSSAVKSSICGKTVAEPLMYEFPNEQELYGIFDEYMFCGELLVAPVTEAGAVSRPVTLPAGEWTDLWSGKKYAGGQTVTIDAPTDTIPVFIRSGAVMPMRLTSNYKLGYNMNGKTVNSVLMLTAAETERTVTVYKDKDTYTEYKTYSSGGAASITAKGGSSERIIVLKGTKAAAVTLDGAALTKREALSDSISGFRISGNDTYVYLPEGKWSTLTLTPVK